jgi:MFS family permease
MSISITGFYKGSKTATRFVVLLGCVSLFSDMTYEAARSISGPYLNILGVSGAVVGWVAGLGELLGYGLRIVSGYLSDKTRKYWTITIIGYILNLFSGPLLAFAGYWQLAVIFMISERIGKAIRTPARDAMLSYGAKEMGRGWGFGLHEAMDQTGATLGPLLVSAVLFYRHQSYHAAFLILAVPAIIAITILLFARSHYPKPQDLEIENTVIKIQGYPKLFWLYLLAVIFIAAGYADFPLIAYHFKKTALMKDATIPILYAIAMAADGIAALFLGKLFDKWGMKTMVVVTSISLFFAPMVFLGGFQWAIAGMIVWGIGMGAQESVLKAAVAELIPAYKRGAAFGLFNTGFGVFWFFGSLALGYLYDVSLTGLIVFSVATQGIAIIILMILTYYSKNKEAVVLSDLKKYD